MLDFLEKQAKTNDNEYLIIMLHGWGSDKYDLISLDFDIDNLHYLSVNAPYECDSCFGYQWFSLEDMNVNSIFIEIRSNYIVLEKFIEEQSKKFNINYDHIFLLGFSQGAMMALYTGIRLSEKIAGIISLSGLLPDTIDNIKNSQITKQNILLLHGTNDNVVPFNYFLETKKLFDIFNFEIEAHPINDLQHNINNEEIDIIRLFIKKCIGAAERT